MIELLVVWPAIGLGVWLGMFIPFQEDIISEGEWYHVVAGFVLTLLLWPVALYQSWEW